MTPSNAFDTNISYHYFSVLFFLSVTFQQFSANLAGIADPTGINGQKFTTRDRDNDESSVNCAESLNGFWFKDCSNVNPNAKLCKKDGAESAGECLSLKVGADMVKMKTVEMRLRIREGNPRNQSYSVIPANLIYPKTLIGLPLN